ncbi:LysR family transcriptional regulator [Aquabacterium humicola]|uniref:LysR family transcriptional regulator n=1 Tax=Aquabacterium humicola TaxID=3237377 RepID=UPI002543207E|nr:LysR family transcriptional regulator [Rubrivivax pictus]
MDRVHSMQVFVRVAQHLGFAAAAREMQLSAAAVTKAVSALEAAVGTRLLDRTTRRVALTEAGRIYLERCIEALQALEDADASLAELARQPAGTLRVTAPLDFRESLMPVVADVMAANPALIVDLRLSNRVVDLVEEGVDLAVRAAHALDGRYVARQIARTRLAVFGAAAYLRAQGRPAHPDELSAHRFLVFTEPRPMLELPFRRDGEERRVHFTPTLLCNDGDAIRIALRRGLGLAVVPSFLVAPDLADGVVEPLLTDWTLPAFGVFAVYPHRRFVSPKVRVLLDALASRFGDGTADPWWPNPPSALNHPAP